ncbi:phage regulatory CII family protein [Devosia sp. 2618]|uniref:phage regulatory CII family protein n=1 Tax=Devosia sp. 2618 TaxID=3156454 RepID=UPI003398EA37
MTLTSMFRRELKGVVKLAVVEAGGQENCANVSGRIVRAAAFSDYANPVVDDRHIPLDVAVELDAFNGNGRIIKAAARMLGFVLVRLPEVINSGTKLGRVTAQAMKECADVFSRLGEVLDDGVITEDELPDFEREVEEAIVKLLALKMQARAEVVHGDAS